MELQARIDSFATALHTAFRKKRSPSNLLPHQRHCLDLLSKCPDLVVIKTDKNLGPAIIERNRYLRFAFKEHLLDKDTYNGITKARAD